MDPSATLLTAVAILGLGTLAAHALLASFLRRPASRASELNPILAIDSLDLDASRAYMRSVVVDLDLEALFPDSHARAAAHRFARRTRRALVADPGCAPLALDALARARSMLERDELDPEAWRSLSDSLPSK